MQRHKTKANLTNVVRTTTEDHDPLVFKVHVMLLGNVYIYWTGYNYTYTTHKSFELFTTFNLLQ